MVTLFFRIAAIELKYISFRLVWHADILQALTEFHECFECNSIFQSDGQIDRQFLLIYQIYSVEMINIILLSLVFFLLNPFRLEWKIDVFSRIAVGILAYGENMCFQSVKSNIMVYTRKKERGGGKECNPHSPCSQIFIVIVQMHINISMNIHKWQFILWCDCCMNDLTHTPVAVYNGL